MPSFFGSLAAGRRVGFWQASKPSLKGLGCVVFLVFAGSGFMSFGGGLERGAQSMGYLIPGLFPSILL